MTANGVSQVAIRSLGWLGVLLAGCAPAADPALPVPPLRAAAIEPAAAPPPPVAWPEARGCRALATALGAMPAAEAARLDPRAAPLALTTLDGDVATAAAAAAAVDLPLPADDGRAPCLLLVEAAATTRAAPRRPLGHEIVRSTYRAGGRRANPAYRALREQLREVERSDDVAVMATGDPTLDLIGLVAGTVLQGIDDALDGGAAARLRARLAATPPTLEEGDWEPYTFAVTTIEATRQGRLRAALVERATGAAWHLDRPVVERRRFRVAEGRRARDRGLLEGGGDGLAATTDVAVWEQAGLRPSLAGLLAELAGAAVPGALSAATEPAAGPAAEPDTAGGVEMAVGADGVRRFRLRRAGAAPGPSAAP
jgi:hypothetical protein